VEHKDELFLKGWVTSALTSILFEEKRHMSLGGDAAAIHCPHTLGWLQHVGGNRR